MSGPFVRRFGEPAHDTVALGGGQGAVASGGVCLIPHFRAWLTGMIAYVSMVNPDQGRRLRETLDGL